MSSRYILLYVPFNPVEVHWNQAEKALHGHRWLYIHYKIEVEQVKAEKGICSCRTIIDHYERQILPY